MDLEELYRRKVRDMEFAVRNMKQQMASMQEKVKILDDKVWKLVERLEQERRENQLLREELLLK